ncbi:MAG: 3'-5' exonuclease [Bacilli bacterium]|nr:3'-5' exonuclease [Bacilli bacterium]
MDNDKIAWVSSRRNAALNQQPLSQNLLLVFVFRPPRYEYADAQKGKRGYNNRRMKYLFFDCECANCYDHAGKICSFGYLICDENLKPLESKDIIINPDAPFDPHVLGVGPHSIDLAYTPLRFEVAEKFPFFFPTIKALLEDKDTLVLGYAIDNDVGFLLSECERYGLAKPEFQYVDIQEIYRLYADYDRSPSLEGALKEMGLDSNGLEGHESKDDAIMSMMLLGAIARKENATVAELGERYPSSKGSVALNELGRRISEIPRESAAAYDREASRAFNDLIYKWVDDPLDDRLEGYGFLFSPSLRSDSKRALELGKLVIGHRAYVVRNLREASYFVAYGEKEKKSLAPLFEGTEIALIDEEDLRSLLE